MSGEVAFEAADRFAGCLAFGFLAVEVGAGRGVGGALTSAIVCSARLSWRSPPRGSRCRIVLPDEAGIGAMPACLANRESVWKRWAPAV